MVNGEGATVEGTVNAMAVGAAGVMAGQLVDKAANAIVSSTSKASTDSIFWTGIGDDGTTAMNYAKQNGGIKPGSTFSRFELPELLNNKNVTSIKYIDIEP